MLIGLTVSTAAGDFPRKAPRASLVQVLRGGKQALLLDRTSGEYQVVKVGDQVQGFRVSEIEEDQIVLTSPAAPERYFVLPLVVDAIAHPGAAQPSPGPGAAGAAPGPAAPAPTGQPASGASPEGAVMDPYGGAVGGGEGAGASEGAGDASSDPSVLDPYADPDAVPGATPAPSRGPGGIPSVIAPPGSRALPGPTSGAEPLRDPKLDAEPIPAPDATFDPQPEIDPGLDPDSISGADTTLDPDADAEPDPPGPSPSSEAQQDSPRDSKVTTVEPTEVRPGASRPGAPRPGASSQDAADRPREEARPLSRRKLDAALADFSALARQMRIERAPGGGIRILELDRTSFVAEVGLQRGDVVKRVAGHPIDTVDQAAAAYAALGRARQVVVEIERRGAPLRLRYRLTR
jgi:hypothetical protein